MGLGLVCLGLVACEGPRGPQGPPGAPGKGASDGAVDAESDAQVEPDSAVPELVGTVTDGTGEPVGRGKVVLLPATRVAELSAVLLPKGLSGPEGAAFQGDEPIEDALDEVASAQGAAQVGSAGRFEFPSLPEGEAFFVVYVPAADDPYHLPGGSMARGATLRASLLGADLALRVSSTPGPEARYVGSSGCLLCHGRHTYLGTAHQVSLGPPTGSGPLQDVGAFPAVAGLAEAAAVGTRLYAYDCGGATGTRVDCRLSRVEPAADVLWFELVLEQAAGGEPQLRMRNRRGAGEQRVFPVVQRYGLARQQQWLVDVGSGVSVAAPFAWNPAGDVNAPDPADWPYVEVDSGRFYDFQAEALRQPEQVQNAGVECAGCHYTGYELKAVEGGYVATAIAAVQGAGDADGDGRYDEINVGCEGCHGPGSEHLEVSPRGSRIVSPQWLTAARASLICGSCHGRTTGRHELPTAAPLNAAGEMPRPGMRRADFLRDHTADGVALPSGAEWPSGTARARYMQYNEFLRSSKHRNGVRLVACDDCHSVHSVESWDAVANGACTACHATEGGAEGLAAHTLAATSDDHTAANAGLLCNDCHMPATAASGAQLQSLRDVFPSTDDPPMYWSGDSHSHSFRASYDRSGAEPSPFTAACAVCHGRWLAGP